MTPRITIEMQRGGKAVPCTLENFLEQMHSEHVRNICAEIAAIQSELQAQNDPQDNSSLAKTAEQGRERISLLKRQLPAICWHAQRFENNKRANANAVPSGLVMVDLDHVGTTQEVRRFFTQNVAEHLPALNICYVAITPSGTGLRIVAALIPGESLQTAQARIADACNAAQFLDGSTKDLARLSFLSPFEYTLFMDNAAFEFLDENIADNVAQTYDYLKQSTMPSAGKLLCREDSTEDTPPSRPSDAQTPYAFKGVAYKDIVAQLMIAMGNADGAIQGERNTVYFSLANYMRYICDFNAALLLQVLPDFNLSREERLAAIHSALGRPRKSQIPTILQGAIAVCQRDQEHAASSLSPLATSLAMPPLPPLLRTICRRIPTNYRPAMIIAALPVLGTLATRVRFQYIDQQTHSFSFFSCITAPAASGKSFIRKPVDLLLTPINEQDAIERQKEQEYKDALRAHKNSKNQPQDPHACPRNNGISISIAKLLQLLTYAEGKHLIGIGEEMDTLVKSERAGVWSQKSDIYRLAFDNAEYGQAYMSDNSFTAHIPVYYNLLLTGTPNSMKRFFKDLENGMVTRVCFAQLPDTSFSEIPTFPPYSESEKEEIIRWARTLDNEVGTISCPQIGKVIGEWLEEKRQQAIDSDSHAADTFRRRAAVIGFRAGMMCFLLEGHKYTNTVCRFTKWVAEYIFRNQMELWGDRMEREMSTSFDAATTERGAASSLLEQLNDEFTTADLMALRARRQQPTSMNSITALLSRWKTSGRIEKISDGHWHKLRH